MIYIRMYVCGTMELHGKDSHGLPLRLKHSRHQSSIVNDTVKQYEMENGKGPISSETCVCCGKAVGKGWADLYVPTSNERTNFDKYVLCRACADTVLRGKPNECVSDDQLHGQ